MAIINAPSVNTFPTARVGDFDALAADSNRRVKARADFSRPADTRVGPFRGETSPQPVPDRLSLTPRGEAISHVSRQVGPDPFGPTNPVTGLVDPQFNLGPFDPTGRATPGIDINVPQARATGVSNVQGVVTPEVVPSPAPVFGPERTDLLGRAEPVVPPAQQGFTLEDLLKETGIGTTGAGAQAALGIGSRFVSQNESQIGLELARERRVAEDIRTEQELESQIASRGAAADVSTATAEKIGFENILAQQQARLGVLPADRSAGTFKTTVIPADIVSGAPAQILRSQSGTGASELRPVSEGGFAPRGAAGGGANQAIALQLQMADAIRLEDPNFTNATDAQVMQEVQRRIAASQGG